MILFRIQKKFLKKNFSFAIILLLCLGNLFSQDLTSSNQQDLSVSSSAQNPQTSSLENPQNQQEDLQENPQEDPIVAAFKQNQISGESSDFLENQEKFSYKKEKLVPPITKPKKISESQVENSLELNEENSSDEYFTKCSETFKFGLEDEISDLIDELTKNDDLRFVDSIYNLFYATKSSNIRNKILAYFTKLKDPCLGNYACQIINDPYDEKKDTVNACIKYVSEAKIQEALPGLIDLVDKEDENYFTSALQSLGELGGKDEALFLADFLNRDDLSVAQRQSLMKVLGKIKAVETWESLAQIAQDEDENSYVRMYAAEAIGAMQKNESEDILIELFESDDSNFRVYVIKGLTYFDDEKSNQVIIQALRDSQYKVRLEAINAVKEKNLKEAVPYLIYRCKDKNEQKSVKEKSYETLAFLNDEDGNKFLISLLKDSKTSDATKSKIASCLLEYNYAGTNEILELAKDSLKSDLKKNLRYSLGKEFAKYGRAEFEEICSLYLDSKDVATQGTGLDIWAKGKYESLRPKIESLANEVDEEQKLKEERDEALKNAKSEEETKRIKLKPIKKANANATKAKRILEQVNSITSYKNKTDENDSESLTKDDLSQEDLDAVSSAQSSSTDETSIDDAK